MDTALSDCCIACNIKLAENETVIGVFDNPPEDSKYRYTKEDFEAIVNGFPISKQFHISGDFNFPKTDWETFVSSNEFEWEIVDLFEENLLEQAVAFNTRGDNLLDIALHRKCLARLNRTDMLPRLRPRCNFTFGRVSSR